MEMQQRSGLMIKKSGLIATGVAIANDRVDVWHG